MYDKGILAKSTGASLGVVAIVGLLFMSTGTAFALPVAGIGGFTIQADEVRGDGLILYAGTSDAENTTDVNENSDVDAYKDQYPVGTIEMQSAEIDGLRLIKVFDLEKYASVDVGGSKVKPMPGQARVVIISASNEPVEAETLMMKTPQLAAEKGTLRGLVMNENTMEGPQDTTQWIQMRSNTDPEDPLPSYQGIEFDTEYDYAGSDISEPGIQLEGAFIRATYLATDEITIPEMRLEVQYDPDNDGNYEYAS